MDLSSVSNGDVTIRYNDPLRGDPHLGAGQQKRGSDDSVSPHVGARDSRTCGAIAASGRAASVVFGYAAAKAARLLPGSPATALMMALNTVRHHTFGGSTPPPTHTAGKPAQVPCTFITRILNLLINRNALSRAGFPLPRPVDMTSRDK